MAFMSYRSRLTIMLVVTTRGVKGSGGWEKSSEVGGGNREFVNDADRP